MSDDHGGIRLARFIASGMERAGRALTDDQYMMLSGYLIGSFDDRNSIAFERDKLRDANNDLHDALQDLVKCNDRADHPQWQGSPAQANALAALAKARGNINEEREEL